jgi:hypothetical protein
MRGKLTSIGSSRSIRIPKPLVAWSGLREVLEPWMTPTRPDYCASSRPASGLETGLRRSASEQARDLIEPSSPDAFDSEEWKW